MGKSISWAHGRLKQGERTTPSPPSVTSSAADLAASLPGLWMVLKLYSLGPSHVGM